MNFNDKIAFKCNNKKDWITCQSILFNLNFTWSKNKQIHLKNFSDSDYPLFILLNSNQISYDSNSKTLKYTNDQKYTLILYIVYEFKDLQKYLRKEKLEKLKI